MQVKSIAECSNEHSAILSTFMKLLLSTKTFVLFIVKWPLKTGLTVSRKSLCRLVTDVKAILAEEVALQHQLVCT